MRFLATTTEYLYQRTPGGFRGNPLYPVISPLLTVLTGSIPIQISQQT